MSKKAKTKLCWNCEGTVATTTENCPYCGVSVVPASLDGSPAHFTPPYKMGGNPEMSVPKSPYSLESKEEEENDVVTQEEQSQGTSPKFKQTLFSVLFLLSGTTFFLFGTVLVLFSQEGLFTLQWDASLWFIYFALSLPLLLLGWRWTNQLD